MSLCRPTRCGCSITSSTLQVTSKVGGGGFNIESYEGVATEVPDTRPGPSDRFEGMRVWTTDTKRLFVWNDTAARWVILSEPVQFDLVAADFEVWQSASSTPIATNLLSAWYQRRYNHFELHAVFQIVGSGSAGFPVFVRPPYPMFNWGSHYHILGSAVLYRGAEDKAFAATVQAGSNNTVVFYAAEDPAVLTYGNHALAPNDGISFNITGPLV